MIHKWSEEGRDEQVAVFLRWVGILVAFTLVALLVVSVQRMIAKARQGVQGTYSSQSGNEYSPTPDTPLNSMPSAAGSPAYPDTRAANAAFASGQPLGAAPLPGATFAAPMPSPVLPASFVSADSAFAVDSQRREAAASLMPLKELMQTIKEFDSKIVSSSFSALNNGSGLAPANAALADERGDEGGPVLVAADLAQEGRQRQAMQKMLDLADGLDANISLYAHPDNFAPPLKDGVGEVSKELHTYLATLRNAVAVPERREDIRSLASKHLAVAEQSLQSLENMTGSAGIGSAAN